MLNYPGNLICGRQIRSRHCSSLRTLRIKLHMMCKIQITEILVKIFILLAIDIAVHYIKTTSKIVGYIARDKTRQLIGVGGSCCTWGAFQKRF